MLTSIEAATRGVMLVGPEDLVEIDSFSCPWCGEHHRTLETAFRWPDVATVTGVSTTEQPDDRVRLNDEWYERGTVRIPIHGGGEFAIGIWARLRTESTGWLANQTSLIAPLYGAAIRIIGGEPGFRPTFELVDHPLMDAQRHGISPATAAEWRAREYHFGEPQPLATPFEATLVDHGWELLGTEQTGRQPCSEAIEVGDFVKLFVRLATVDDCGALKLIHAGWWLVVDHVEDGRISGTLNSVPKLPTTLACGTRMAARRSDLSARALITSL
ncbi:MAG: hypothetical protein QM831_21095 [Kofleriaceae bacterium]